jgi:hypothetical protein
LHGHWRGLFVDWPGWIRAAYILKKGPARSPRRRRNHVTDGKRTQETRREIRLQADDAGSVDFVLSPIAWQDANLHGRHEFQKQPDPLNVDEIIRELTELPIGARRKPIPTTT